MKRAVILGAGFSKAVSPLMPDMNSLGEAVRKRLPNGSLPDSFGEDGSGFEVWLSEVGSPQPYLEEAEDARNWEMFLRAGAAIYEVIGECQDGVLEAEAPPEWLSRFVGCLHHLDIPAVTFNYDLLLEATVTSSRLRDSNGDAVSTTDLLKGLPPTANRPPNGMSFGTPRARSFRYLKLHGSLDAFWVPGDASGATIARLGSGRRWGQAASEDKDLRREVLPGRDPFIVPPTATKTGFYGNPISRELWRSARRFLASADEVSIIGYSLPLTDLVSRGLLGDSLATASRVIVVNPDSGRVADRLRELLPPETSIDEVNSANCCQDYVSQLEGQLPVSTEINEIAGFESPPDAPIAVGEQGRWYEATGYDASSSDERPVVLLRSENHLLPTPSNQGLMLSDLQSRFPNMRALAARFESGNEAGLVGGAVQTSNDGLGRWFVYRAAAYV